MLLTREHGRVGVACGVLGRRLRHLQGLPGLWHPDIELLSIIFGTYSQQSDSICRRMACTRSQGGHSVVIHQALGAKPPNLVDDAVSALR